MKYKVLLWDMDGTLMDSKEGLLRSLSYTLEVCGLPPTDEKTLRSFLGPSLHYTFTHYYGFSEERAQEAVRIFRQHFAAHGMLEGNVPYPGIMELLESLKQAGYRMAVATSKLERFAHTIGAHFGLTRYFEQICGSDAEGTRPEKPEVIAYALTYFADCARSEILMIGDRRMDVEGAAQNGIDAAAVLYGYGDREELTGAKYILPSVVV